MPQICPRPQLAATERQWTSTDVEKKFFVGFEVISRDFPTGVDVLGRPGMSLDDGPCSHRTELLTICIHSTFRTSYLTTKIPTNGWLLLDVLGHSMSDVRLWPGNRDASAIGIFAQSQWEPYNVYEIVSEYTLCEPISS
jgi:hypothetical protein